MQKSKYSLLLSGISNNDQTAINEILTKFDSSMKIKENEYIDSKKIIMNKCMIIIEIKGYMKIGDTTKPIWEIKSAERCVERLILTAHNMLVIDIDCGKPQEYYKYIMYFFIKPIIYSFQVKLFTTITIIYYVLESGQVEEMSI